MGTQFSSRLTPSDTKRILAGIRAARESVAPKLRKRASVESLPSAQQRRLGDATLGQVLRVAEERDFSREFQKSDLFVQVLDWLKMLRSDADFAGFQSAIAEYELEGAPNPLPRLLRGLQEITGTEAAQADPFRVSVQLAAKRVLAEVAIKEREGDSPAQRFGRQLASLDVKTLVGHFVSSFIADFLSRLMSRSDPSHGDRLVADAKLLTVKSAGRVALAATKRVEKEGKLTDSVRIRDIVFEELRRRAEAVASPVPE